jgi:hypothetical protein
MWLVEADDVVPTVGEREAVGSIVAAVTEVDRDRTVVVLASRGDDPHGFVGPRVECVGELERTAFTSTAASPR